MTELTTYRKRMSEWIVKKEGSLQKLPLFAENPGLIILPMNELIWIDVATGAEKHEMDYPLDEVGCCSADADGTLYLAGGSEGAETVVALDPGGHELWRWKDEEGGHKIECRQPPVLGQDGRVFVMRGDRLDAVQAGKLLWSHEVEDGPLLYASAFQGGSLLFATAGTLYSSDADGKVVELMKLSDPPVAPPAATLDGDVYLLTAAKLMKLR
jgi:outer membrane protein assembly factor BamB